MTEEKERKETKAEEKQKPSLFGKWKKLAVGGLLGLSMIMPMKNAEGYHFDKGTEPPYAKWGEQIKQKYPDGWGCIIINNINLKQKKDSTLTIDKAVKYFKQKYEKTKDDDALYMYAYSYYQKANNSYELTDTEIYLKQAIEICNKDAKDKEIKENLLIFKSRIFYNLGKIFWEGYRYDGSVSDQEKAIKYLNQGLEEYKKNKLILNKEDRKWMEEEGPINDISNLLTKIKASNE